LGILSRMLAVLCTQQTLLGDRAIFFLQSDPEAERSVINDQLGRAGQAQAFELPKQFTPGLAAFVISKRQRQAIRHPGFF